MTSAVILNDQQDRLLIRRANEPFKGRWALISGIGASKKGLPPDEAIKDEVAYDIGAEFEGELCFDYELKDVDYATRVYVFLGKIADMGIRLNKAAASEFRWFSAEELENEKGNLAFNDEWILEIIRNGIEGQDN